MAAPVFYNVKSSDGVIVEMSELAIKKSKLLIDFCENLGTTIEKAIPLQKVDEATLRAIAQWCEHNKTTPDMEDHQRLSDWDDNFFKSMSTELLFKVTSATAYLDMKGLMHASSKFIANALRGKSAEEMKRMFAVQPMDRENQPGTSK